MESDHLEPSWAARVSIDNVNLTPFDIGTDLSHLVSLLHSLLTYFHPSSMIS